MMKRKIKNLKNGIIRNNEPKNLLLITFPRLGNKVFGFFIYLCATIMLQTMRDFISKHSLFLLLSIMFEKEKCSKDLRWQRICDAFVQWSL